MWLRGERSYIGDLDDADMLPMKNNGMIDNVIELISGCRPMINKKSQAAMLGFS